MVALVRRFYVVAQYVVPWVECAPPFLSLTRRGVSVRGSVVYVFSLQTRYTLSAG